MNMNAVCLLKASLQKHIAKCNELLYLLENHHATDKTPNKKKKVEGLVEHTNSQFIKLMDSIPSVAIQGYNKRREVIYWNKASEDIYGYTEEEALGKTIESLIAPEKMSETATVHTIARNKNKCVIPAGELTLGRKTKTPADALSSHLMLNEVPKQAEMFFGDVDLSEIIKLKIENKTLKKKIHIDLLTGTYNRLYFNSIINNKIKEMMSEKKDLSLIMLDIDHFKKINDTHGHDIGDISLKQLSTLIKSSIRKKDMLFRWGGEEFMLLVEASLAEANMIANKLRKTIVVATEISDKTPSFTCSFGIVSLQEFDCFDCAYKAVDEMLYRAKSNGRNRVECMQTI